MELLLIFLLVPLIIYVSIKVLQDPLWGILVVLFLRPIEPLLGLESVQLGRIMGVLAFIIWFYYLFKNPGALERLKQSKLTKYVSILVLFLLLGTLTWAFSEGFSFAVDGFVTMLLLGLLAIMLENVITSKSKLLMLLLVFSFSGALAALPAAAFMLGYDLYSVLGIDAPTARNVELEIVRADAIGGGANTLGILARIGVLASLLYLLFDNARKKFILVFFIISLMGLVLSGSRTNFYGIIIAASAFLVFLLLYSRRNILKAIIGLAILGALGYLSFSIAPVGTKNRLINLEESEYAEEQFNQRNEFRKEQQMQAITLFKKYPLTGVGFYRSNVELDRHYVSHDTFSVIVGETGLFGIIPALIFFFGYFRIMNTELSSRRTKKHVRLYLSALLAIFLALITMGFFGGLIFFYDRSFWTFLGISFAAINLNRHQLL